MSAHTCSVWFGSVMWPLPTVTSCILLHARATIHHRRDEWLGSAIRMDAAQQHLSFGIVVPQQVRQLECLAPLTLLRSDGDSGWCWCLCCLHLVGFPWWRRWRLHLIGSPWWRRWRLHLVGSPWWRRWRLHLVGSPWWRRRCWWRLPVVEEASCASWAQLSVPALVLDYQCRKIGTGSWVYCHAVVDPSWVAHGGGRPEGNLPYLLGSHAKGVHVCLLVIPVDSWPPIESIFDLGGHIERSAAEICGVESLGLQRCGQPKVGQNRSWPVSHLVVNEHVCGLDVHVQHLVAVQQAKPALDVAQQGQNSGPHGHRRTGVLLNKSVETPPVVVLEDDHPWEGGIRIAYLSDHLGDGVGPRPRLEPGEVGVLLCKAFAIL